MYKRPKSPFGLPWRQPANPLVKALPEVSSPQEVALPNNVDATETMARALEATGNYKILRGWTRPIALHLTGELPAAYRAIEALRGLASHK